MSFLLFFFFFCFHSSSALPLQTSLVATISKDPSTLQFTISVYLKTPLKPTKLLLDLGASFSWVDCRSSNYKSSTYAHIPCNSTLCTSLLYSLSCSNCYDAPAPACGKNSCALFPENSVTRKAAAANAIADSLALPLADSDGRNSAVRLGLLSDFIFSCAPNSILKGLAQGISGLLALGRSNVSLPAQVSTTFSSPYLFALCLPISSSSTGVAFFGSGGPYYFSSQNDLSKSLIYTPLLLNPVGSTVITYYKHPSDEYYINLTSIKVNGKPISLNGSLLAVDESGSGGTKISTVVPYTALETSIYTAFTEAFKSEAAALNLTVVATPAEPFGVCYSASSTFVTLVGPAAPTVDLVMDSDDVYWRIFGSNSMVKIEGENEMWCVGFVDGGVNPRASIVIGGHQMVDNLLQFDLASKRVGFSSSLLVKHTSCANFSSG